MINVDISNIWGELSLPDLLNAEKEVFDAHMKLTEGSGEGGCAEEDERIKRIIFFRFMMKCI